MLDKVFFAGGAALGTDAAAVLETVFGQRGALDVAEVGNRDDHVLVSVEVLGIEVFGARSYLGAALVAVLGDEVLHLVLDNAVLEALVCKDFLQVVDQRLEVVILSLELVPFESCQLAQTHLDDGVSLGLCETELLHKTVTGFLHSLGRADVLDDKVYDIQGLEQTFEDVGLLLGGIQVETGPAEHYFVAVADEIFDEVLEVEQLRAAVHKGDVVD